LKRFALSVLACLFILCFCTGLVQAQTVTYYHAIENTTHLGNLTGSVPIGGTVYITLQLTVTDLGTYPDGNRISFRISDNSILNLVRIEVWSDKISVYSNQDDGTTEQTYLHDVSINGLELISAKFDSIGNMQLWIDSISVHSEPLTSIWINALTKYSLIFTAAGTFEVWATDSPLAPAATPTPTPTATPAPTPTPTSWVHNTAVPIGQNIGGLNTIILLLLLAGVGLSMTMLIFSKLKSNIIEAIIIMFIMGTAGLVAIYWLIGGFA
jgi:hypothetical protein